MYRTVYRVQCTGYREGTGTEYRVQFRVQSGTEYRRGYSLERLPGKAKQA